MAPVLTDHFHTLGQLTGLEEFWQTVDSSLSAPPQGKALAGHPQVRGGHPGLQSQSRGVKGWGLGPAAWPGSLLLSA